MVLLCPAAIKATANKMGAVFPKKPGNNLCASFISATCELPDLKNTAAARTSMAALTKKATLSATVVSILLNFMACLMPASVFSIFLVCTNAECRYKLCGITVAPIIPIPIYNALLSGNVGTNPVSISEITGCAINICIKKQVKIMATSEMIKASILRMPNCCKYSSKKVSNTVMLTPQISGKPVSS